MSIFKITSRSVLMFFIFLTYLFFSACSSSVSSIHEDDRAYYKKQGIYPIKGEIDRYLDELLNGLKDQYDPYFKEYDKKMYVWISDVEILGSTGLESEFITNRLLNRFKHKFNNKIKTTRFADGVNEYDKHAQEIKKVRDARNNDEFDQHTTIEKGTLHSATHILSGKVTQKMNTTKKEMEATYTITLNFANPKDGETIWSDSVSFTKTAPLKNEAVISVIKENNKEYGRIFKTQDEEERKIFFTTHFVAGVSAAYIGNLSFSRMETDKYGDIKNVDKLHINIPARVNLGVMFDFRYLSVNLNALYGYANIMTEGATTSLRTQPFLPHAIRQSIGDNEILRVQSHQVGGEMLLNFLKVLYVSGGAMFDVASTYSTKTNHNLKFEEQHKFSSYYPFARAGFMFHKRNSKSPILYFGSLFQWNGTQYAGTYFDAGLMLKI